MTATREKFGREQMQTEKRAVAQNSVWAAIAITSLKTVVGITTGSLGILSEAAHSGLDLVAAVVTLFSVRVSDKPADADHQFGHEKVENFSAFIEMALLTLTCVWIVYEAFKRLFFHSVEIEPSVAAFLVMFFSIATDFWRSRSLKHIANKYDSQALAADALHFSTDIWSSSVVIIGLAAVEAGQRLKIPWLRLADPFSALIVAGVVMSVSTRLGRQTVDALLDAAPTGIRNSIIEAVNKVDGVLEVNRARIRRSGSRFFVDLSIGLARTVTFQRSEQVASAVSDAVHAVLPDADVVVSSVPRAARQENLFDRIRAVAARSNFHVHDISIQNLAGHLYVEQHLELDENLTLKNAHNRVTELETEIRREVPEISFILTHIESEPATIELGPGVQRDTALERVLQDVAKEFPEVIDVHELQVKHVGPHMYASFHCTMGDDLPLSRVHELSTELEARLKQQAPGLFRVLIHTEPLTDNLR
jgi:cation diffusion facilitator family transporter